MGEIMCFLWGIPWKEIVTINVIGGIVIVAFMRGSKRSQDEGN